jgi:EAL domain-containing protein (putative c-di-GMP-specific phosphodiesterase class I)
MMSGVAASTVRLEVTEGVAIMDAVRTAQILDEIRAWGVRTSLDDFGTGYSSLSYLRQLPFDSLKIDRSFVTAMTDQRSRNIIKTIVDLARTMDMSVVAEGVETENQHIALMAMGCSMGQGYFYGRPSDATEAFALIRANSRLPAISPEIVRKAL